MLQSSAASRPREAQSPLLKRKASDAANTSQVKALRIDGAPAHAPSSLASVNGINLSAAGQQKSNADSMAKNIPYRGTAGILPSKSNVSSAKSSRPALNGNESLSKGGSAKEGKPTGSASSPGPTSDAGPKLNGVATKKTGGYMAMLQKAKEKDQSKPPAPLIKHEVTKIMTKKEIEKARLEAKMLAKGKKSGVAAPLKHSDDSKGSASLGKKPPAPAYHGTARPASRGSDISYKGTARPAAGVLDKGKLSGRSKGSQARYGGYASWSDDQEDDEEEDYDSGASSDMEGGIWDVEQEERVALKAAKEEDAKALAEENALKQEKEARKRKLMALNKAAAAKRKF